MNGSISGAQETDDANKRKPNFSDSEKFFLVRQYEAYRNVLGSRDGGSNKDKQFIWKVIADELNKRNPLVVRTPIEVRKKWQNLLTFGRKEIKEAEIRGTPTHLLPWIWRKVYELAGPGIATEEDDARESSSLDLSAGGPGEAAFIESAFEDLDSDSKSSSIQATGSAIVISSGKEPVIDLGSIKDEPEWGFRDSVASSNGSPEEENLDLRTEKEPKRQRTQSPNYAASQKSSGLKRAHDESEVLAKTIINSVKAKVPKRNQEISSPPSGSMENLERKQIEEQISQRRELFTLDKRKKELEIELLELEKEKKILENTLLRKKIAN